MKVTYFEDRPLDGQGTLINPAYKWFREERTEFCDSICKAGNLWYMLRGGYVFHSINPMKIKRIETTKDFFDISNQRFDGWFYVSNNHGCKVCKTFEDVLRMIL